MAKGARASSVKANNLALKKNVFGPVETARNERLHAKLAALIAQPKPSELKAGETMETAGTILWTEIHNEYLLTR